MTPPEAERPSAVVSVVLIFLNAEPFLDEAIRSVRGQTLPDWELLLVDDGSSDGSSATARRHAAERPDKIRYLEHPGHANLGMSASRNLGISQASAPYVAMLDADDVLAPAALQVLWALLEQEPRAAMAYGPVEYWYSWAGPLRRREDFVQRLGVPPGVLIEPPTLLVAFLRRRAAVPSGMMIRSGVLRRVGGFEDAFRGMYEDQALCVKICLRHAVITTDRCGYRYRQHPGSSSAAADRSGMPESGRRTFLDWLDDYLMGQDSVPAPVLKALKRERWWLEHPRLGRVARRARRWMRSLRGVVRR